MKIEIKKIKISEIVYDFKNDMYTITDFQRKADAWSNKNKELLIKSVLENFYIPPLLFSNRKILDGLQRLSCLNEFINDEKFKISINNLDDSKFFWSQLPHEIKKKISDYELIVVNVLNNDNTELSNNNQKELFIRINENSIKLNTAEKFFSICDYKIREMTNKICENSNLHHLAKNKKGKRFSIEMIIIWCLTIVYYRSNWALKPNCKTSIRNLTKEFGKENLQETEIHEIINRSNKTINLIYEIIGDNIPTGKFKVIFTSIFVPFYENVDSRLNFLNHKSELESKLRELFFEFVKEQQIGGVHYDSYIHINESIEKTEECLKEFINDNKRIFTQADKDILLLKNLNENNGKICCSNCGKILKQEDVEFDHIIPFSKGGKTNIENGQILCKECNRKLGSKIQLSKEIIKSRKIIELVQKINDICNFSKLQKDFDNKNPGKNFSKIYWINELKILDYQETSFLKNLFDQRNKLCHPNNKNKYWPFGKNIDSLNEEHFKIYLDIIEKIKAKLEK